MSEKLVRDNIPSIALHGSQTVTYRKASPEEMDKLLMDKLHEELEEFFAASTHEEIAEEAADVIEVLHAIVGRLATASTLDEIRNRKTVFKGAFRHGWVMEME